MTPKQPQKEYNVGIEVEVDAHPRISSVFSPLYGVITHDDGSIRKPHYLFNNYPLSYQDGQDVTFNVFCRRSTAYGTELTTSILTEKTAYKFMRDVEKILGHIPPVNPRASIHIHVDVRNEPWTTVYKVLLLFYILESPLYRFACAGEQHRGTHNDFLYCRPISHPIGIYLEDVVGISPCVRLDSFLSAKTATQLLESWGYVHNVPLGRHYLAHRLMGINLRSVLERGSLEWRIFDGRYKHASAFLRLVLAVHRAAELYQVEYLQRLAKETAWIFGSQRCATLYDVFSLLFPNASSAIPPWMVRLWGTQEKMTFTCIHPVLESHYDARNRYYVATGSRRWCNNNGDYDDGSVTFPLYTRQNVLDVVIQNEEEEGDDE